MRKKIRSFGRTRKKSVSRLPRRNERRLSKLETGTFLKGSNDSKNSPFFIFYFSNNLPIL
jgi:hypothetical protein